MTTRDGWCRRASVRLIAGLILSSAVPHALAAADIDLSVLAIRATNRNAEIAPELKHIADQLKKQFKFTGFKLEQRTGAKAPLGTARRFDLPAGYTVSVTPSKLEKQRLTLEVVVARRDRPDPLVKSNVTIDAGKVQLFGGSGWKLDGDDVLIVGVSGK